MVSVSDKATVGALVDPYRKGHLLDMPTTGAALTRVCRVDSDYCPASLYRFAEQHVKELRPRSISYTFRQFGVFDHIAYHQGLHRDQAMLLDDLVRFLVSEIFAAVLRPFVNACHPFVQLLAFSRCARGFVSCALRLCQVLFFLPEEAGILDRGAIGEIGEGFESHIDAYLLVCESPSFFIA